MRIDFLLNRLSLCALGIGLCLPGCNWSVDLPAGNAPQADVSAPPATKPLAAMGVMVGEVTDHQALIQVRLTKTGKLVDGDVEGVAGMVEFIVKMTGAEEELATTAPPTQMIEASSDRDFIARAKFTDLTPGTSYTCQTWIGANVGDLSLGPSATFKTLPGPTRADPVQFVVVTGMNYGKFHGDGRIDPKIHLRDNNTALPKPYDGPDKHLGYPALATILKLRPNFFVGTGDNVYYDTPKDPRAETVREMRQKWHEQFVQPRYVDLFAEVPTYWEIDDHDYRIDDGDNSGDYHPSPAVARRIMMEQLPYASADDTQAKTYRTHRVNRDLQIWLVENRIYRSDNALPDGPNKSIWGAEQKAWLKQTLQESDATFKILISPNPMIGPDDRRKTDNHTNIGGFQYERDEFFDWLIDSGVGKRNFYIICGDRHWQYHSIHPKGIEEFSCGALVDANSRIGRKPGDPQSTDPEGLIKQVYAQQERSAGFLLVKIAPADGDVPAQLTFLFHDEKGETLYKHVKQGKPQ
jgi:alkaline phosphatase/alkaline phosphatase D